MWGGGAVGGRQASWAGGRATWGAVGRGEAEGRGGVWERDDGAGAQRTERVGSCTRPGRRHGAPLVGVTTTDGQTR